MKRQMNQTVLRVVLLVAGAGMFAWPTPALVSADVADFTGDQSDGILSGVDFFCPPVYTLNIYNLTTDITPASNSPGVGIVRQAADGKAGANGSSWFTTATGENGDVGGLGGELIGQLPYLTFVGPTVNFTGGEFEIISSGMVAGGIQAESRGGNGGAGGWANSVLWKALGGAGGSGGWGMPVTVTSNGGIHATGGFFAPGIWGVSVGGAGGAGGATDSAEGAWGGAGGAGGSGRAVTVHNDGDISTGGVFSAGILATSAGGDGGVGGSAHTGGNAYGGQGGAGGDGGTVIVTNDGSIQADGILTFGVAAVSGGGTGGDGGSGDSVLSYGKGGDGGRGGTAGPVEIYNYGDITITSTMGSSQEKGFTAGILGQSLGGIGGNGGSGSSIVGVGGSAQGGGSAGSVDIENTGVIHATGLATRGILAQSVGGYDGSGGTGSGIIVGWGGSGRSAGDAGLVEVGNSGAITATGDDSVSILAQSIGGGGGDPGYSAAGWVFAVGGTGSAAGNGGAVTVTNTGPLQTSGADALGIAAQSIGGGGGFAGLACAFLVLGGSGDSSGNGDSVTVANDGSVTTTGHSSDSISAQSIGGGGGIADGAGSINVGWWGSIGGSGGAGGDGGIVTVNSSGDLQTSGDDASGIRAQSIGGGGGRGGWSFTGFASPVVEDLTVSALEPDIIAAAFDLTEWLLGGGGGGGDGNQVDVTTEDVATISTEGDGSFGIHAQSVGGGGGSGRLAKSVGYFISTAIGGDGGGGGNAGAVNVTSDSAITTQGDDAHGILAQSIGGGGGAGGNASAVAGVPVTTNVDLGLVIGSAESEAGAGGAGGDGGFVTVNSTGDISTSGLRSAGILGQSVGGGGGDGGNSVAEVISVNGSTVATSIGGAGGDGGNGGVVDVDSSGGIATQGGSAYGIVAQSIGGGGGSGGNSTALTANITVLTGLGDLFSPTLDISLSVGGSGGDGGDGALVDVDTFSTGGIVTQGDFAHGILVQSVGGGGGAGGDSTTINIDLSTNPTDYVPFFDFLTVGGSVAIGGSGGLGGNGDQADVTNGGSISTAGNFAAGVVAQSIGGGGGVAGRTHSDYYGFTGPGSSMVLEGSSGGRGNGGNVTVLNNGDITTEGGFAPGILAQSIGGGGGFAGISEDDGISTLSFGASAKGVFAQNTGFGVGFSGSAGGWGSAGAVSVTHTGSITTLGDMSHGILAQSAAGYGTAGPVTVTLASDIMANGVDSDGIHAQSVGGGGRGDISINIGGGMVRGGSGAGTGVNIDGGVDNTLTNAGSISALSGTAIIGGIGNDTVNNNGIVTGTVRLGTGTNAFNNNAAGILNSGALIDLGAGNALTNAGILSPGGTGTILNTILIGDLVQSASGVWELEIGGFTPESFDSIDITGTLTGETSILSLSSTMGGINFSFLPGYDIASEIGPGQSMTLQFLNAGDLDGFASGMSYSVLGSPWAFQYDVFQQDGGLFLRAVNTIPAPGALLLGSIGLGLLGWGRRRMRS